MTNKKTQEAIDVTIGRCTKELTGPLVHTFQCLARAVGVARAFPLDKSEALTPDERFWRVHQAYSDVYDCLCGVQEPVMDKWKRPGGMAETYRIADALQSGVNGDPLQVEPYLPFLPEELHGRLPLLFTEAEHSLRTVRKTAAGQLISSGRNWRGRYKIVDKMLKQGYKPKEIQRLLEREMVGDTIIRMKVLATDPIDPPILPGYDEDMDSLTLDEELLEEECASLPGLTVVHFPIGSVKELVEAVRYEGKPVYQLVGVVERARALIRVQVRFVSYWTKRKGQTPTELIELTLPDPWFKGSALTGDGHVKLRLAAGRARMYRPILFLSKDGEIGTKRAEQWLADCLMQGALAVSRLWGNPSSDRVTEAVGETLRQAFLKLTIWSKDPASQREALIRRYEFQVQFPAHTQITGGWTVKRTVLTHVARAGYNLWATSKNHPGTVVTKANKRGLPPYKAAISGLARYQDGKRICEEREQRQALPLWEPMPLLVRSPGAGPLPPELAVCFTQLTTMIGDVDHINRFLKEGADPQDAESWVDNDTFVGFPSVKDKVAITQISWECEDPAERDALMARLIFELGADPTKIWITPVITEVAEGLYALSWKLTLTDRWDEVGKVKAAVGGGKGVFGILPYQPLYRNGKGERVFIDLMIPRRTAGPDGKKQLEMVLHMLCAKAKLHAIDPDMPLSELVALIRTTLVDQGRDPDGLEQIVVEYPDGTKEIVGYAVVGPVPFYRPKQTASNQFRARKGLNGIKVHTHAMIMGVRTEVDEAGKKVIVDRVKFQGPVSYTTTWDPVTREATVTTVDCPWGLTEDVYHSFTRLVQARERLKKEIDRLDTEETGIPHYEESYA